MSEPTNPRHASAGPDALPDALPPQCVRGPDGVSPDALLLAVQAVDDAVLAEYRRGLTVLGDIRRLLQLREMRAMWAQQRAFALTRLRALERAHPWLVAEVLATWEGPQ